MYTGYTSFTLCTKYTSKNKNSSTKQMPIDIQITIIKNTKTKQISWIIQSNVILWNHVSSLA